MLQCCSVVYLFSEAFCHILAVQEFLISTCLGVSNPHPAIPKWQLYYRSFTGGESSTLNSKHKFTIYGFLQRDEQMTFNIFTCPL